MSIFLNFLVGSFSGMGATSIIQPIDMVKVRIQLRGEAKGKTSPFDVAKELYKEGGVKAFYRGLDSALLRQAVYCGFRMGLYYSINDFQEKRNGGVAPTAFMKSLNSLVAGAIGSGIANPCDLALVRMQADSMLPEAQRRNYKNVLHAIYTILKTEGIKNAYRGCTPTIGRAMSLNLSMMVTFDVCKEWLQNKYGKGKITTLGATWVSGVFVAVCALPFDNMKTKLQKQTKDENGNYMYKNLRDCFKKTFIREGPFGYWTGLPTFYMRCAPHAMFCLIFAEFWKYQFGLMK